MKRLLPYIIIAPVALFWIAQAFSAALSGTNVAAPVVPFTDGDSYPTHQARYGKGGFMQLSSLGERDLLPAPRRENYMLVDVRGQIYQLYSGSKWRQFSAGGGSTPDLSNYVQRNQQATLSNVSAARVFAYNFHVTNSSGNTHFGYATPDLTGVSTYYNTLYGHGAGGGLLSANSPSFNTLIGFNAGTPTVGANYMTAVGSDALGNYQGTGTAHMVAIGYNAGTYMADGNNYTQGKYNTYIGSAVKPGANNTFHEMAIGYNAVGRGSNTTVLGTGNTTSAYIFGLLSTSAIPARRTSFTPTGNITETNLQAALAGVDSRMPQACVDIFDGAPALSCAIDGGSLAFTYDPDGANPLPAMLPYTVKLYEVGLTAEPITPDTIHWSVPTNNTLLTMGQYSTQSTFSPNRFGIYSASKSNNWVKATLTKGLKTCIAMLPVSATKIGAAGPTGATGPQGIQGEQGPPGESATVTKEAVQAVFTMDNPGGTSVVVRPKTSTGQTNTTELITVGDTAGYKRAIISGTSITTYRSNGTTKAFSIYSGVLTLW